MPYRPTSYQDAYEHTFPMKELGAKMDRERATRENWSEEQKLKVELINLGDGVRYLWHSREEVARAWWEEEQRGDTIGAILSGMRIKARENYNFASNSQQTIESMGRNVDNAYASTERIGTGLNEINKDLERLEIKYRWETGGFNERIIYNRDGIRITEGKMQEIVINYFKGTKWEDTEFKWGEFCWKITEVVIDEFISKEEANLPYPIEFVVKLTSECKKAIEENEELNGLKQERAKKELDLRTWILTTGVEKLKNDINISQRAIFNYKVDKGEELPILTEFSYRINNRFDTNLSPIDLIAWATVGLVALICFGLWFVNRRRRIRR